MLVLAKTLQTYWCIWLIFTADIFLANFGKIFISVDMDDYIFIYSLAFYIGPIISCISIKNILKCEILKP